MTAMLVTPIAWSVHQIGCSPADDDCTVRVSIEEEGAGLFIVLHGDGGRVYLEASEWPAFREAVERAVRTIEGFELGRPPERAG